MNKTASVFLALGAIACALQVGCGKSPAPPAPLPTQGTITDAGEVFDLPDFTITLPDNMVALDASNRLLASAEEQLNKQLDPARARQLATLMKSVIRGGQFKLIAFDVLTATPAFTDNLNVLVQDAPVGITQATVVDLNIRELGNMGIELLKQDRLVSDRHQFDRLHCKLPTNRFISYLLVHGGKSYTLTFSMKPEHAEAFEALSESVMRSFVAK